MPLHTTKSTYFSSLINNINTNYRTLFSTLNNCSIPQKPTQLYLLTSANLFPVTFYFSKINNSLTALTTTSSFIPPPLSPPPHPCRLSLLLRPASHFYWDIIIASKTTTCSLNPLPTTLTKACLPALSPHLTALFNLCLSQGHVPYVYKTVVTSILKI